MTEKPQASNTLAPLKNVALCNTAIDRAVNRARHLPGMVCFYGFSGLGKSLAAAHVANRYKAYYIEAKSSWTKKAMLIAILNEMGAHPKRTIYEMTDQVAEQLVISNRPLIIDEMDHIVNHKAVEIVRDIYEGSGAPMLIIGEERMPHKLKEWERFHGRILDWIPAQPCDMDDAAHLRDLYCKKVEVADDLLEMIVERTHGSTRRICINLERVQKEARTEGKKRIDLAGWGDRPIFTGEPPARRV